MGNVDYETRLVESMIRSIMDIVAWAAILYVWGWMAALLAICLPAMFAFLDDRRPALMARVGLLYPLVELCLFVAGSMAVLSAWGPLSASLAVLGLAAYVFTIRRRLALLLLDGWAVRRGWG